MSLSAILYSGCLSERFTIKTKAATTSSLRLNGYYSTYSMAAGNGEKFVLYSNGVIYHDRGYYENDKEFEKGLIELNQHKNWAKSAQKNITRWGVYTVEDRSILMELRDSENYGAIVPRKLDGEIINDTLIYFKRINLHLKFHQFNHKPDSTNRWNNTKGILYFGIPVL